MTPLQPRRGAGLTPVTHGAIGDQELASLGLAWSDVADFSHNSNPFAPLPSVLEAVRRADVARYPDPEAVALRQALAAREGLALEQVIAGNGSNELFWLTALAFLRADDPVLVLGPTYGEYEQACRVVGARWARLDAPAPGFCHAPAEVRQALGRERPRLLFLCNPNNPTGVWRQPEEIANLLGACEETLLVLDESYLAFVEGGRSAAGLLRDGAPNLLVVRSMTKDHSLAGLRLGYALGPPAVIAALRAVRPHWNVNAMAQAAGQAALAAEAEAQAGLARLRALSADLAASLADLGLEVRPSAANFFLVRVGDGAGFRAALLHHGCVVRDCASFGLPQYVRIAPRSPDQCRRLVQAVAALSWPQPPPSS